MTAHRPVRPMRRANVDDLPVHTYRVGWLATIPQRWRPFGAAARFLLNGLRQELWFTHRMIAKGNWRAVRNTFNGYLAEPLDQSVRWRRCGTGWTRRRALRDLQRHLDAVVAQDGDRDDT